MKTKKNLNPSLKPMTPKELADLETLVDQFDARRLDPNDRGFGYLLIGHPCNNDLLVHGLLTLAARSPGVTREEEVIIAIGQSALPHLVRAYLDPDPILSRDRVEDMIFRIADRLFQPLGDVSYYLKQIIYHVVPKGDVNAAYGLLSRIDNHDMHYYWSGGIRRPDAFWDPETMDVNDLPSNRFPGDAS